jgi:arylsulfatase A-like enzyme/HEAT repeat protein
VSRGGLGGWTLLPVLLVVLFVQGRDKLASNWELERGVLGYLPLWLLGLCLLGALGGLWATPPLAQAGSFWKRLGTARTLSFALFGGLLGWGVGGGRHLAAPGVRIGFSLALAGVAALGLALWFRALWALASRGHARLAGALLLAQGALCELVNAVVLVRLYPAFHLGLSVLTVTAWAGAWTLAGPTWRALETHARAALSGLAALLIGLGLLVGPALRSLERFDNFRWVLLETSPTLGLAVQLGARLHRPKEDGAVGPLTGPSPTLGLASIDFRGRSVLLVTVDALRADHVGAYGYGRGTSPHLDALARQGVLFEAAYAPTPHTSYSVLSLMTGKYMRPLLLQGVAQDSDLWAVLLRTYGYKTAAFYPPAVFFIDQEKFQAFERQHFGFEYFKVEFAEGGQRTSQVEGYLRTLPPGEPLFLWLHLFGPHEPYEEQKTKSFGATDVDRYDSEIASADETLGRAVELMRARDPNAVVIVTADHGEEFGDHGGRYHGTTLYEEQVRVPLIVAGPGLRAGRRVTSPVQTVDLLPTVLRSMDIPVPPRLRGRDLGPLLLGEGEDDKGLALAETDELSLLAEGRYRLICHRPSAACRLFDLSRDPGQTRDVGAELPRVLEDMKARARALSTSHGRFEAQGLRSEGKGWPAPIVRGLAGEADAAPELAQLLEDVDTGIRAKAAEVLFRLATGAEAPALRLALAREEDPGVRAWLALGLTRLGQGAPLVHELLTGPDPRLRRLAALALGLSGDDRGEDELISWFSAAEGRSHEDDLEILSALGLLRSKAAVGPLLARLSEVRLSVPIAETLAKIGDKDARPWLTRALGRQRYHPARVALGRALLELGAKDELVVPLRHFLGVPDALPGGLGLADAAGVLEEVGGPDERALGRLRQLADSGVDVSVVVPPLPSRRTPRLGARVIVRARASGAPGRVHLAPLGAFAPPKDGEGRLHHRPDIGGKNTVTLDFPKADAPAEVAVTLPEAFGARPGHALRLAVFAEGGVLVDALAVLPLREEIPPPPPEPWKNGSLEAPAAPER